MDAAARVLGDDRDLADLLVGVTGDFVPASEVLSLRTVGRVARGLLRGRRPAVLSSTPVHAHRR
jgi:hypothetical protein